MIQQIINLKNSFLILFVVFIFNNDVICQDLEFKKLIVKDVLITNLLYNELILSKSNVKIDFTIFENEIILNSFISILSIDSFYNNGLTLYKINSRFEKFIFYHSSHNKENVSFNYYVIRKYEDYYKICGFITSDLGLLFSHDIKKLKLLLSNFWNTKEVKSIINEVFKPNKQFKNPIICSNILNPYYANKNKTRSVLTSETFKDPFMIYD